MSKLKKKNDFEKIENSINSIDNIDDKNNSQENISISSDSSEETTCKKKIIFDAPVNITIELGRSKIKIKELLDFSKGSMFFLDRNKNDPLKIFANGKLIALGEIVMSENTYGVKIISIKNSLNTINE
ncbi:FliM/FliN family flagellar motor switch protein [Buchnera aphidicola (Aphis aurantii)]|uniref:FliM/FliN family flagellar motor switch protein n=1 Tax=Buchnera aphidicola TaxID=9 RepID=UPI0031B671FE